MAEEEKVDNDENRSQTPLFLRFLLIASLLILLVTTFGEFHRWQSVKPLEANSRGPTDNEIVPGIRIGFITLHLAIQEVESRLGNARLDPTDKAVIHRWDNLNLKCVVEDRKVTSILTSDPNFHTRTGVHTGSPVDDVIRSYGDRYEKDTKDSGSSPTPAPDADQPYVLHYFQQGVHFSVNQGTVRSIWVTEAMTE